MKRSNTIPRGVLATGLLGAVLCGGGGAVWGGEALAASPLEDSPPAPYSDSFDWMQFKNGEWLKGEVKELHDDRFTFESDLLDTLQLDWEDINAVYSSQPNTLMFEDRSSVEGTPRIEGDQVVVTTAGGEQSFSRGELRSIIPGRQTVWNHWSGKLSLGATVRRGNVDQTDVSAFFRIQRRSPATRLRLDYKGVYGEVDKEKTANNHLALLTFYYIRVIEIPTPRWVMYDRVCLGAEIPKDATLIAQERGYTSPHLVHALMRPWQHWIGYRADPG